MNDGHGLAYHARVNGDRFHRLLRTPVRRRRFLTGAIATLALGTAGCNVAERVPALSAPSLPAPSLPALSQAAPTAMPTPAPTPEPTAVPVAAPDRAARQFLDLWQARQFPEMYALLSRASQDAITQERFVQRYRAITEGATILTIQAELGPVRQTPGAEGGASADAPITVNFTTARLGPIRETNTLPLVLEDRDWRISWSPGLIFRDLTYDTVVRMFSDDPVRGSIYDRQGRPLATQDSSVTVGVVPGDIQDEGAVLGALSGFLKLGAAQIKAKWADAPPGWFVPIKTLPAGQGQEARAKLGKIPGIELQERAARVYPHGQALCHSIGFVGDIDDDLLKKLAHRGYEAGDPAGRNGVERWGEEILGGERGGRLVIMTQAGAGIRTIAEKPAKNGGDIYLSIDIELQKKLEEMLKDRPGSVVVLDPRDNSVLALATFPRFDPNKFITGFGDDEWRKLRDDPRNPFQNRPVASMYPTGSVFKVVTISAGLERGGFSADSTFTCRGSWDGLGTGLVMGDWLKTGHGKVHYTDGLIQSCNIVNYETGKKLDGIDRNLLPNHTRQFGYGEPTGIVGVVEAEGVVPSPEWKQSELDQAWFLGDAVNLSIGQGYFQATPLQVANVYSALAAGGALRSPVLVQKTTGPGGEGGRTYTAIERRKLPISEETRKIVHACLKQVAANPNGTAYYAFKGVTTPTAAKTGSAENQGPDSHAWFAGYAPADQPEIALVCMLEGSGAGSEIAAPLGREVVDFYFSRKRGAGG